MDARGLRFAAPWTSSDVELFEPVRFLAASPAARRLSKLHLWFSVLENGDEFVAILADSPHLGRLTTLNLEAAGGFSETGLRALADSPHLPCLTYIDLRPHQFAENGWQSLVEPGRIAGLGAAAICALVLYGVDLRTVRGWLGVAAESSPR